MSARTTLAPRTWGTPATFVAAAPVVGLAAAWWPVPVLAGVAAATVGAALLLRVEWAALSVVASAVFEDYLHVVDPRLVKGLAVVLVLSWVLRRCRGPLPGGSAGPVPVATLVLLVVLLAATAAHPNGPVGLGVLLRWLGFVAVLLVLVDCFRSLLAPSRAARAYVWSCAVASGCGLLTYVLADERRVGGPIGDPNDLAVFLLAALPLALALRAVSAHPRAYDAMTGLLLLGLLGTLSRGALVGLAAALAAAVVLRQLSLRTLAGLVALAVGLVGASLVAVPAAVETSLDQKEHVADQNVSERLELWQTALRMTADSPVLGLGPGAFQLWQDAYRDQPPADVNHRLDVAHNTYLETSSEAGVLGLLALLGLVGTAVVAAGRRWRRSREPLAGAVVGSLVGVVVASFFVTEQYLLPLWLLVALAALPDHPSRPVPERVR